MMGMHEGGMVDELGLTEPQRQQMRALHTEARKAGIRARADLQLKRLELEELLEADEPNQAAIDKTIGELNDLRATAFKRRIDQRLAFHRLLTPEQRGKLKTFREHRGMMLRRHLRQRFFDRREGEGWQRRGRGFERGPGFGRGRQLGPGMDGGPDFDLDFEEMEPDFDPDPQP
jgi:Spy/CpxP family protein refolding chaperone